MNKICIGTAIALAYSILLLSNPPARSQSQTAHIAQAAPISRAATVELPTLRKGMSGEAVSLLQSLLGFNQNDMFDNSITGYFDDKTEEAVKEFQRRYNLPVNGIVGPKLWEWLAGELWDS